MEENNVMIERQLEESLRKLSDLKISYLFKSITDEKVLNAVEIAESVTQLLWDTYQAPIYNPTSDGIQLIYPIKDSWTLTVTIDGFSKKIKYEISVVVSMMGTFEYSLFTTPEDSLRALQKVRKSIQDLQEKYSWN